MLPKRRRPKKDAIKAKEQISYTPAVDNNRVVSALIKEFQELPAAKAEEDSKEGERE